MLKHKSILLRAYYFYISVNHAKSINNRDIIDVKKVNKLLLIKGRNDDMKKSLEYMEVESPSISIERKKNMMEKIYKTLEELGANSKETAKTSKEINNAIPKSPITKDMDDAKKIKKVQLNTPSFVGSLSGVMSKSKILGKVYNVEKQETTWYVNGNIKMINDIDPRNM